MLIYANQPAVAVVAGVGGVVVDVVGTAPHDVLLQGLLLIKLLQVQHRLALTAAAARLNPLCVDIGEHLVQLDQVEALLEVEVSEGVLAAVPHHVQARHVDVKVLEGVHGAQVEVEFTHFRYGVKE